MRRGEWGMHGRRMLESKRRKNLVVASTQLYPHGGSRRASSGQDRHTGNDGRGAHTGT
jgi:hypothetical protein